MRTYEKTCMQTLDARIRGEYLEMPGLTLTLGQACRLWNAEPRECMHTLEALVASGFLCCSGGGVYLRAGTGRRAA